MDVRRWGLSLLVALLLGFIGFSGGPDYRQRPLRVLCIGDDWVASEVPFHLWRFLQARIGPVEVFNEGRLQHSAYDILQFAKNDYDRLADLRPDVVLILVGVQDGLRGYPVPHRPCEDVGRIVRLAKTWQNPEGRPTLVALTPLPDQVLPGGAPAPAEFTRRVRAEMNPCFQDIADQEGVPLVDLEALPKPSDPTPEVLSHWLAL
ncbi:MAG: SGNH/GDSL hydrolase family protein, partial [Acidobacteriota bacterium]|nr:SGNH/GDSL hydrolase family protein [Acidobacteriota bacterium]